MRAGVGSGERDRRSHDRPGLGKAGEEAAALYLQSRGYRIAARNVRIGRCELDLVLRRGLDVVICEVKTRRGAALGLPEESVDARKQARIMRAAGAWLSRHPPRGNVRFDVVSVAETTTGRLALRHIEGAFRTW